MISGFNFTLSMIYPFILALFFGFKVRKSQNGFITWKESFFSLFLIMGAGTFVYLVFNHLLNTVIDPDLPMKVFERTIEWTMDLMEGFGASDADLDKTYESFAEQKEEMINKYTLSGFVGTYFSSLLFVAFIAALVSLFVKKENPNPFAESE